MSNKKRDSRQFIFINEEKLINEVQQRPILYNKALKGYRKPTIREMAWQEVASELNSTVEESKKRWRSLRDAFMKQYKMYSVDGPMTFKRKKWLFYDQMEFLEPFLEFTPELRDQYEEYSEDVKPKIMMIKAIEERVHDNVALEEDDEEENTVEEVFEINHFEELIEDHEEIIDEEYIEAELGTQSVFVQPINVQKPQHNSPQQHHQQHPQQHQQHQQQPDVLVQNNSVNNLSRHSDEYSKEEEEEIQQQCNEIGTGSSLCIDPDERFLLSCAPILKRLSNKRNALARLKVQELLYEIEFGDIE